MVGEVGIEPTLPKEHDFESCAYTSSATRPISIKIRTEYNCLTGIIVLYLAETPKKYSVILYVRKP